MPIPSLGTQGGQVEQTIIYGQNPVKALPAPIPKYLQERQNIPPLPKATGSAVSSNPIPLKYGSQTNPDAEKPVTTLNDLMTKDMKKKSLNKKAVGAGVASLTALGASSQAQAKENIPMTDENAIRTILGEAEAEGADGMKAHASTLRKRGKLQGAYGYKAIVYRDGKYYRKTKRGEYQIPSRIVEQAKEAWKASKSRDFSGGATNWFSAEDLKQDNVKRMIKNMTLVKKVGNTSFYRE